MKIALIGASGRIGSRILDEAAHRGHTVLALCRPSSLPLRGRVGVGALRPTDIFDANDLAQSLQGQDALVSAFRAPEETPQDLARLAHSIVAAARRTGLRRVVLVGGAGSLEVSPGLRLADTPDFPAALKVKADAHDAAIAVLRAAADLDWTVFAPAAQIAPGERTGHYRSAVGALVTEAEGRSRISYEDFAHALVTALEQGGCLRQLASAGYVQDSRSTAAGGLRDPAPPARVGR